MTMSRFRYIRLVLLLGTFLFIPFFLAYSVYVDLSGTVLLSCDMSFEDPASDDSSTLQDKFGVSVPTICSNPSLTTAHFDGGFSLFSPPSTSHTQTTPVLRC